MSGLRLLPKLGSVGGGWAWDDSQTPTLTPPAPQEDKGEAMSQSEGEDMSDSHFQEGVLALEYMRLIEENSGRIALSGWSETETENTKPTAIRFRP